MPFQNAFNTGRDIAVDFNLPQGLVRFSIVTDVGRKQNTKSIESHGIDGVCRYVEVPGGWEGTLEIDRAGPELDQAIAYLEGLYYAGQPVPYSTITETISEISGKITVWRFTNVAIKGDDLGSWKGDAKVTQKLGWKASFRTQVQ
jgi:hypothetical protein